MAFPATHQSVLERVRSTSDEVRRRAFGDLAEGYWRPSYHYLRLHWQLAPDRAEDVVQAFFTTAFEKRYIERYDPAKARFRTFLRTCLDRFVQNSFKAEQAEKRGGRVRVLSLDFPDAEHELTALAHADASDVERFFHDETIRSLFSRTVEALQRAYEAEGKRVVFEVFARHDLNPTPETSYASVASALALTTAQVTNYLHGARRRFRDTALAELRSLVGTDEEYRAEARELFGVEIDS